MRLATLALAICAVAVLLWLRYGPAAARTAVPAGIETGSGPVEAPVQAQAGPSIRGTVYLPDGSPAAFAAVSVRLHDDDAPLFSAFTDASGAFEIADAPARCFGKQALVRVYHPASGTPDCDFVRELSPSEPAWSLRMTSVRISGRAVGEGGQPFPWAHVEVLGPALRGDGWEMLHACAEPVTANGTFAVDVQERARYLVVCRAVGFATVTRGSPPGGHADVYFLQRGVMLSGSVSCDGEPVADAAVTAYDDWGIDLRRVFSAPDGSFRMPSVRYPEAVRATTRSGEVAAVAFGVTRVGAPQR